MAEKKQALIIGSRGYLGYQIKRFLIKEHKYKVINYTSSVIPKNLEKKILNIDLIIHAAGPSNKIINKNNYLDRLKICKKFVKLLENKKKVNFIYLSSVKSKMRTINLPKKERLYSLSHKLVEEYIKNKKNFYIFQLSNIFGLNYKYINNNYLSSPLNTFIKKINQKKDVLLLSPNEKRNFVTLNELLNQIFKIRNNKKIYEIKSNFKISIINMLNFLNIVIKKKNIKNIKNIKIDNRQKKEFYEQIVKTSDIFKND